MKVWEISFARSVIRTVTKHLHNNIRCMKNVGTIRENFHSLSGILVVRIASFRARPSLHYNFQSRLGQIGDYGRHQRNTPLPWVTFSGHPKDHAPSSSLVNCSYSPFQLLLAAVFFPGMKQLFKHGALRMRLIWFPLETRSGGIAPDCAVK
jgi:hypothetical protein